MVKRLGFGRAEKLKSRKQIEALFSSGKSITVFPLRATYLFFPGGPAELRAGFSASKKNFPKAVDRNRVKRLLREAYRLQKERLCAAARQKNLNGALFFLYTDKTIASFPVIRDAMEQCLKKLEHKMPVNEDPS